MSVSPDTQANEGKLLGGITGGRESVSFMLQKDHIGVGCEMHRVGVTESRLALLAARQANKSETRC